MADSFFEQIDWDEFTRQALSEELDLPHFTLTYESIGEIAPTAVTAVNKKLFERAVECGFPGIVICVCDYTKEALAFSISRAISNSLYRSKTFDIRTANLPSGTPIALGEVVVEYVGIAPRNVRGKDTLCLGYKRKSRRKSDQGLVTWQPLNDLPEIHACKEGSQLTSSSKMKVRDALISLKDQSKIVRSLHEKLSSVESSVVVATSMSPYANIPPTVLKKATISFGEDEVPLTKCFITGRFSKGEIRYGGWENLDGTPSLLAISRTSEGIADLFDAYDYLEEGGRIDTLVIEAPTVECVENQKGCLQDIIDEYHVPVIIFCEESILRKTRLFKELGMPCFTWGPERLKNVLSACNAEEVGLSHREICAAKCVTRLYPVPDDGRFSSVGGLLYGLRKESAHFTDEEQAALLGLIISFNQLLKQTEMIDLEASQSLISKIKAARYALTGGASGLSLNSKQVDSLNKVIDIMIDLCQPDVALPKEPHTYNAIMNAIEARGHSVCLVVSNQSSERTSREYWKSILSAEGFDPDKLRVVTARKFLKEECTSDDEEVLLSGWFIREETERLIKSGMSSSYSIIAYRGEAPIELETQWYVHADAYWNKASMHQEQSTVKTLGSLGIKTKASELQTSDQFSIEEDSSLPGIARKMERDRDNSQAAKKGEEACLGRRVWFTSGANRWLRISENGGDALPVVTNILEEDGEECRKTAAALQEGDLILRSEADDNALGEACRLYGSYATALEVAHSWHEPIRQAKKKMGLKAIGQRIINAGCKRTPATIARWIRDPEVIAPNDYEDIEIIGKALDAPFSEEKILRIMDAASIVRGSRIVGGKQLRKDIMEAFIEDARAIGDLEQAALEFGNRHQDLGNVELLCVDHIGEAFMVPIGKFGWYAEQ